MLRTGRADRRNYSGRHRRDGLHFLALTDERDRLIWISAARPGRTHDITAAHDDHVLTHLRAAGLGALADLGFRPGQWRTRPRDRHRLHRDPCPQALRRSEGRQPRPRHRTRTG
ncbi:MULTISPECIES: transposase family protein [Streptomyces]|uniref:Transposase family protein n=1 Tax=Streptomyces flaveolus TaxID=67297 RepID=A0ABV3AMH6_9ACTN|nr:MULTISPECIES: transposase family protein [Streptomyces]